jgi:hypothetical protein
MKKKKAAIFIYITGVLYIVVSTLISAISFPRPSAAFYIGMAAAAILPILFLSCFFWFFLLLLKKSEVKSAALKSPTSTEEEN